mgnify:CR=1 FL=1
MDLPDEPAGLNGHSNLEVRLTSETVYWKDAGVIKVELGLA